MFGNKKLKERIAKLEGDLFRMNSTLHSLQVVVGELQRVGKRRMSACDLKDELIAWKEINHILYRETIKQIDVNGVPTWVYGCYGPWGFITLDMEKRTWWIEDKPTEVIHLTNVDRHAIP
jgi:hypothetical protein